MSKYRFEFWLEEVKDNFFWSWVTIITFFKSDGSYSLLKSIRKDVNKVAVNAYRLFRIKHAERLKNSKNSYTQLESLLKLLYIKEAKKFLKSKKEFEQSQVDRAINVKAGIIEEILPLSTTESDKDLLSFFDDVTIFQGQTNALHSQNQIDDFGRAILFNDFISWGMKPYQIAQFLRENRNNLHMYMLSIFLYDLLDEIRKQTEDYLTG